MTTREKVAHLLRRFGLGVTQAELDRYEPLGVRGALETLLDYEKTPDTAEISPWAFVFGANEQLNLDANRMGIWWGLKLATTPRPLEEKLTVFWHDHFAVSASKVESGPIMLQYNQMLRRHASGNFRTLLGAVTRDPAMLRWLDGDTSVKGKPNENFSREVLELFTMGIGNYSEKDVQELARAFTGWGLRQGYRVQGRGAQARQSLMEAIAMDIPLVASAYSEGLHDDGPKTVLGKTDHFDTESALDWIVSRPATATYIAGKLWEYFAYPNPEPRVIDRIAKVFVASKYEIKPVLRAIADAPEFWSENCVRRQIKSPLDFTVAFMRQLEIAERLQEAQAAATPEMTPMTEMSAMGPNGPMKIAPVAAGIAGTGQFVYVQMQRQGMRLLYPPDVAGWEWGEAWVSPAMMAERMRFANGAVGRGRSQGAFESLRQKLVAAKPESNDALVDLWAKIFDAPVPADRRSIMVDAVAKAGGIEALARPQAASGLLLSLSRLTFGMPEFQLC